MKSKRISAMRRILEYFWPGNVRELENAVERAFVLSGSNAIKETDLPPEILTTLSPSSLTSCGRIASAQPSATNPGIIPIPPEGLDLDARLLNLERAAFEGAIRQKDGNREAAARLLGIKPHAFRKRAKEKFGL